MNPFFKRLLLAFQFLTIIRIKKNISFGEHDLAPSMTFYPLVGLLLGALQWGLFIPISQVLPKGPALILTIAWGVFLTRGFHLDGLADTADGLWGGHTAEDALRIMKDSRIGTFGVVALILDLLSR